MGSNATGSVQEITNTAGRLLMLLTFSFKVEFHDTEDRNATRSLHHPSLPVSKEARGTGAHFLH